MRKFIVAVMILAASAAVPDAVRADNPGDEIVAVVRGRIQTYRTELFGKLAASIKTDQAEVWLDYRKADGVSEKRIAELGQGDGAKILAAGRLEVRDVEYLVPTNETNFKEVGDKTVPPGSKSIKLKGQLVLVVESIMEATPVSADAVKELERLQGDWVAVSWVMDGRRMTADELKKSPIVYRFQGSRLTLPSLRGERGTELGFEVRLDPSKSPRRLDMKALDPILKGGVQLAIYHLEGDELTLCIPTPDVKEPPAKFEAPARSDLLLVTFRRVKR